MDTDTLSIKTIINDNPETLVTVREFHNDEASTYWLPKDADEHDRLTGQHFAFKELLKENISSSVKETLDFKRGISVLDIGCGSGAWMADMSLDYPNCTYHGCDIIDTPDIIKKLPCLKYTYGNVTQKLPYEDNTFDFALMRFFVFALRADEWPNAIKEALRVVKPGGMVQFVDCTFETPENTDSNCYRTIAAINKFSIQRWQQPDISYVLEELVSVNNNAKIVQSYQTLYNLNDGTSLAKKFMWDYAKGVEGMMKHLGPLLGIETKDEISDHLLEFKKDMFINGFKFNTVSLSVQKVDTKADETLF
ncbi:S-adenosyl-L-methionine-dependent methyltransferase [Sporodiniella umbellata]|nr:S-adenosyl-L-methionine-dependent methyltransferase [Sporodiniella umbellata]